MRGLAALLVVVAAARPAAAQEGRYVIRDPRAAQRVDYLIIAGDRFAAHCDALAAHRTRQGHAVGVLSMGALTRHFASPRTSSRSTSA